ncbi:MAG TPA: hypothetical protein VEJ84_21685 [Acidimicrobiales bacterium]|nr:hypothetical protein [Acidimicrobiales bacterium]
MRVFREGYAFEASVAGHVLMVPLISQKPLPRWLGVERILFGEKGSGRRGTARVNLAKLTAVSSDGNDRNSWFDLFDARGHSLRLLFGAGPKTEKELGVLAALRDHVTARRLQVDPETMAALENYGPAS